MADEPLRIAAVSLDCADPQVLGKFYVDLLDADLIWDAPGSVGVRSGPLTLIAQRVDPYAAPSWPGSSVVHLDLTAGPGLDISERRALALGAIRSPHQPHPRWRVLLDPAGHPFCLTTLTPD